MANFDQLKQSVAALIRTNGAEEITGQIMQDVLLTIINSISGGYMFGGVAQHSGNVGNPDYNVFYLAGSGAYTGYGGAITIENGCYGVFRYNGSWTQEVVDIGVRLSGSVTAGETRGCTGNTINTALQTLFDNVMNILDSLTFTYNTPSAQQATKAMLDVTMTPTGGNPHVLTTLTLVSATALQAGLMSAEDKKKVDRMLTDFRSLSLTDTTAAADQATKIVQTLSATLGENPEAITTMTFLAATVSKAGLMSADDKSYLDSLPAVITGINGAISDNLARVLAMMGYYECSTDAGTAAKVVSASGYALTSGGCIRIKMTNANTADNVTLNINSTGAKALYYDGAQASSTNTWEAGEVLEVYYDGTQYQCASGGGGKFATGENVSDVGITNTLDDSHNLIESAAVNAVLNESINFSEWVVGSLGPSHTYVNMNGRIEACAVIDGRPLIYNVASGYAMSIHEYSGEFYTIPTIIGSTWIKQSSSWIEGSGTFTPASNTKTIVVILSKTPTSSSLSILPSDSSNLTMDFTNPFTLDEMRQMLREDNQKIDIIEDAIFIRSSDSPTWYQGTLVSNVYSNGGTIATQRIIATLPTPSSMTVTIADGYSCSIHEYSQVFNNPTEIKSNTSWIANSHGWFTGTLQVTPLEGSKTMVFILAKGNRSQAIVPSEGSNFSQNSIFSLNAAIETNKENITLINDVLYGQPGGVVTEEVPLISGGINANGTDLTSNSRLRTASYIFVNGDFTVDITNGIWYNIFFYLQDNAASFVKSLNTNTWSTEPSYSGNWKGYIRIGFRNSENTTISPSDTTVTLTRNTRVPGVVDKVEELTYDGSDSYYWGVDMIKRKCRTTNIGTLKYQQAFCKYDGKYYSTDGSSIAEQDESFTVLRDVSCNVGHGNSLQLVSNGKAWASGWNDQKMYRVSHTCS